MRARLTGLLLATAIAAVAPPAPAAAAPSAAGVRVLECRQGQGETGGQATFRAVARRVAGARSMWIRLRLEERTPRAGWRAVGAPGLGVWRKSRPGVGRFAVRQRVLALAEGSSYRVVARIRWYDGDGNVLLRARRRSRPCRQPGNLPNLRVRHLGATSLGNPGLVVYRVDVVNRGPVAAPASAVRLTVDGDVVDTVPVPAVASGAGRAVWLTGPPCEFLVVASVDPADVVREGDERDNSRSSPCGPS